MGDQVRLVELWGRQGVGSRQFMKAGKMLGAGTACGAGKQGVGRYNREFSWEARCCQSKLNPSAAFPPPMTPPPPPPVQSWPRDKPFIFDVVAASALCERPELELCSLVAGLACLQV